MQDFEGLGTFYLGARYDIDARQRASELVLYDSKDLVTHAVCVGMTGSGKTGLCTVLLEEAAIDGIPALVIDPKGDLANLMLAFPEMRAADFAPWVDPESARAKGQTVEEFAAAQAELWMKGLASWGQDGARIARMRAAAEFAVYTPGSSAGRPLSIVQGFAAPDRETLDDAEAFRERVQTTVSSLLALAGIDADPVQGREHILLSTIVQHAWSAGRDLDLGALIGEVQKPALTKIGVLDLESFYPAKERFALALALNNLLASPGFASWMDGEPLDIDRLLYTAQGKPRIAILSIAHLSDAQRMFFVALLLGSVLGWVRRQRGTSSLRALIYMDEIAGYFPPVANPPSKAPLLTLMKQARAFGVGVVLATQNPVDLDYKGLANAGTWFVGRLQTERDKARLLDGLEGAVSSASAKFDRAATERTLSQLQPRTFLMHDVHAEQPVIFETRWALSYLRGPMTRAEIKQLSSPPPSAPAVAAPARATPKPASSEPAARADASAAPRPVLPPQVPQYFLAPRGSGASIEYRPMVFGSARVFFEDSKAGVRAEVTRSRLARVGDGPVALDWRQALDVDFDERELASEPEPGAAFAPLPPECAQPKSYEAWKRGFADHLYRDEKLELACNDELGVCAGADESERDFRLRLAQLARERRDAEVERIRAKFAPKMAVLQERKRKREQARDVQAQQARDAKVSTALSFGSALLSAFLGRKAISSGSVGRATTAARGVSRSVKESGDVSRAEEDIRSIDEQLAELESNVQAEIDARASAFDAASAQLDRRVLKPKKSAIAVRAVVLVWAPYRKTAAADDGEPAW